jgi:hypothetical protein
MVVIMDLRTAAALLLTTVVLAVETNRQGRGREGK